MTISKEAVEAAAREIYEAWGYAYEGRAINGSGRPYGNWERAWNAAERVTALPFLALRPAPSQSEEAVAVEKLVNLPHELERSGYNREFFDKRMRAALLAFAATVRAEATLAGAAAEREAWELRAGICYSGADIAAKDLEIAALREALKAANQFLHPGNVELGVHMKIDAALYASPAPDPAEAMRDGAIYAAISRAEDPEAYDKMLDEVTAAARIGIAAEAMRAKCEAIAQTILDEEIGDPDGEGIYAIRTIISRITAIKGNGEGL